jgi:beta-glucuronidase
MTRNLEEIHRAFPNKPIVVSEYGLCECNPKNPTGDARRIRILSEHTQVLRGRPYVGGAIFFCYNDYRTHVGDKGVGPLKQRVHGVVDLMGARKPSFEALRAESSPVESVTARRGDGLAVTVRARRELPAYTLADYTVRCTVYGYGGLPMERVEAPLPELAPGQEATVRLALEHAKAERLQVDVVRPTGFSAATWEGQG